MMDPKQAMLMAQINKRRAAREQAFGPRSQGVMMSPAMREHLLALQSGIMDQLEIIYDLSMVLDKAPGGEGTLSIVRRCAQQLDQLYQRGKRLYLQAGNPAPLREKLILLHAAVVRLEEFSQVPPEQYANALSEVGFLLAEAAQLL